MSSRRRFLAELGGGFGSMALAQLLAETPVGVHHPAKAKRVVQLFMSGAASQCDTFDYKPQLISRHGQKFDPGGKVELFQSDPGAIMKSPWDWIPYGLGSLTQNLPTFVVLPDARGFAPNGPANWSAGFLPAAHQGTMIRAGK